MSENIHTIMDIPLEEKKGEEKKRLSLLPRSLSRISNATYNTKKVIAQGMMDIALFTANANQIRYIVEYGKEGSSTNYVLLLLLLACSVILQVSIKSTSLIFY